MKSEMKHVSVQELLDTALAKIKGLHEDGGSEAPPPNGIGSVQLEVDADETSSEFHFKLKVDFAKAAAANGDASIAMDDGDDAGLFFNSEGHHVVALIAMADLQSRSPQAARAAEQILLAGDRTLEAAAVFPDDIRNEQPETKPFHFVDIPLQRGGPLNPPLPHAPHVISEIATFSTALAGRRSTDAEKVDALSWLIHLFGDIHQPMHCIERISDEHPGGDRGGNSFKLRGAASNLHSLWDRSVDFNNGNEEEVATAIMGEHPRASLAVDLQVTSPEAWARACFKLAKKFAYSLRENPANPPRPSAAYLRKANEIARRQAALAGYRLSDRLQDIFGGN